STERIAAGCQVKTVHCGLISDRRSSIAKDAEPDRSTSRQRNKCNDARFDQVTFLWILRSEAHAGRSPKNETTMTAATLIPASPEGREIKAEPQARSRLYAQPRLGNTSQTRGACRQGPLAGSTTLLGIRQAAPSC